MESLFNLILWGTAGLLALAPLGAGFGAVARSVAQAEGKVPDTTRQEALLKGAAGGAAFLAIIGFVAGVAIALYQDSFDAGVTLLATFCAAVVVLMAMAIAFAGLTYFCTWLGVRATGLLLALGIGLTFAGFEAHRAGYRRTTVAWSAAGAGLAGLGLVLGLRLRSPHGNKAFDPLPDDADLMDK